MGEWHAGAGAGGRHRRPGLGGRRDREVDEASARRPRVAGRNPVREKAMEGRLNVATVWGIPIGLHFSWLFVFGLVTWSLAGGYFPAEDPGWARRTHWLVGGGGG